MILGPELAINGGFDEDSGWDKTENWSWVEYENPVMALTGVDEATDTLTQEITSLVNGKQYRIAYRIDSVKTSDDMIMTLILGGTSQVVKSDVAGFYVVNMTCGDSDKNFVIQCELFADFDEFDMVDISIREIINEVVTSGHAGWYPKPLSSSSKERNNKIHSSAYGTMPIKKTKMPRYD